MIVNQTKGNHANEHKGNYSIILNKTQRDKEQYKKKSQGKLMVKG
jgi:hypothetical protein